MGDTTCDESLTDQEHARLAALIDAIGETNAAERLRICRTSVLRLLSRRPVRLGTISLARVALSRLS
jgi:hypothetical protein